MSPMTGCAADRFFPAPRPNEMTSVGPACARWRLLRRAISRAETNAIETSASRTPSALSTAVTTRLTRAEASGLRAPSAATSTMMLMTGSSRLHLLGRRARSGSRRLARGWLVRRSGRVSRRHGPEFGRDPTARCGVFNARVVHSGEHAGKLVLHRLELGLCDRRIAELALVHPLSHDPVDHVADLLGRRIVEHARGGLRAVGQHDDRRLDASWR